MHRYTLQQGDDGGSGGGGDENSSSELPALPSANLDTGNALISSEDVLTQGRKLVLQGVPLQVSSLYDALAKLRATAAGSTAEIFPQIIGQVSALRNQYSSASQAVARRLGYAGGGQTTRARQGLLANAGRQYGGLIEGQQQAGFANLVNALSAEQPALSGAARPPSTGVSTKPQDFSLQGAGLAGLISTAQALQNAHGGGVNPAGAPQLQPGTAGSYSAQTYGPELVNAY